MDSLEDGAKVMCRSKLGEKVFNEPIKCRRVAVVGQYNAGKTWLLQNLFGFKFPQGKMQRTKGLSMKMDESRELLIIDSAGNLEPVSSELAEDVADAVHDRKDVELINKEFLVESADVVILVVNQLTWPEQEAAQALANRCHRERLGDSKLLIMVHNMSDVYEEDEAKRLFHEQIGRCYRGAAIRHVSQSKVVLEFVDDSRPSQESSLRTRHFGVGNQHSPAGKAYNQGAFQEMLNMIDHHCPIGKLHSVKKTLEDCGSNVLPQFFFTEGDAEEHVGGNGSGHQNSMQLKFFKSPCVAPVEDGQEKLLGLLRIAQRNQRKIHLRHRGVFTALGDINTLDLVWEPPVSVTIERGVDGTEIKHITVEAPECTPEHVEVESLDSGILVTVHKPFFDHRLQLSTLEETRRYGTWKRLFEFVDTSTGGQFDWWEEGFGVSDGVVHIRLRRRALNRSIRKATVRHAPTPSTASSECSYRTTPLQNQGDEAGVRRLSFPSHAEVTPSDLNSEGSFLMAP